jgi:hypothetical protein
MKTRSVLALLVLAALVALGLMALARTPSSSGGGDLTPVDVSDVVPAENQPSLQEPTELLRGTDGSTGEAERSTAPTGAPGLGQGTLQVTALDAITGQPVKRFWMKQDAMLDAASASKPLLSDPMNGSIALAHTEWDSTPAVQERAFVVSSPRHSPMNVSLRRPRGSAEKITLRLLRAASIVGTVRDGSSAALTGARVTLEYHGPAANFGGELGEPVPWPEGYQGPTLRLTGDAGEYSFSHLPAGVYRTRVQQGSALHGSDPILVRAGEWSVGDHWLDEHVRLNVVVRKADGTAAVDTRVLLVEAEPPLNASLGEDVAITTSRYTSTEGRATLGPLTPGNYGVYVQSDDGFAAPLTLEVTETSHSLLQLSLRLERDDAR